MSLYYYFNWSDPWFVPWDGFGDGDDFGDFPDDVDDHMATRTHVRESTEVIQFGTRTGIALIPKPAAAFRPIGRPFGLEEYRFDSRAPDSFRFGTEGINGVWT